MAFKGMQIIYITTDDIRRMGESFEPKLMGIVCLECKEGPGGSLEPCEKHLAAAQAIVCWAAAYSEEMGEEVELL